jgi:hypothetical protein
MKGFTNITPSLAIAVNLTATTLAVTAVRGFKLVF